MFLDFDHYFVNLSQVTLIGLGVDTIERDHGDEPPVCLWIHLEDGDPIRMPQKFETEAHANTFKRQIVREAMSRGILDDADLESIFYQTLPLRPVTNEDSHYTLTVRGAAPLNEIRSALHNFADHFGTHQTNSDGDIILWSDTQWNCGTAHPVKEKGQR
jgi:hypothetical protein